MGDELLEVIVELVGDFLVAAHVVDLKDFKKLFQYARDDILGAVNGLCKVGQLFRTEVLERVPDHQVKDRDEQVVSLQRISLELLG